MFVMVRKSGLVFHKFKSVKILTVCDAFALVDFGEKSAAVVN